MFEALMLVMFLAFTLVLAYRTQLGEAVLRESRGLRRITVGYLVECRVLSLSTAKGLFAPTG